MKVAKTRHVFWNTGAQWAVSGMFYAAAFAFFIWYHDVRGKPFSLFTTEKCIAIASVCCLALALTLGPLSRFAPSCARALPYRRSLGLVGASMSICHALLATVYLPIMDPAKYSEKFLGSWYLSHWLTTIAGILILVLFLSIAIHSYPPGVRRLGKRKWAILQKGSYLVMILVVIHLLSMDKIPENWIAWIETRDQPLPPGSFPTMMICLVPLLLKAADLAVHGDSLAAGAAEEDGAE